MSGYYIAAEALDLEIYQLACTIAASNTLHKMGETNCTMNFLTKTFERSELSRHLIALAVTVRNLDGDDSDGSRWEAGNRVQDIVGILIPNYSQPKNSEALNFREACNKIIHAKDLVFYRNSEEVTEHTPISHIIELRGSKGKNDWVAELDLFKFIEAASIRV